MDCGPTNLKEGDEVYIQIEDFTKGQSSISISSSK